MLLVGISGSIGSGKTTVCKLFERLGIPVYYSDTAAKSLMHTDTEVKQNLIENFGPKIYDSRGALQRKVLGNIVFNDRQKLDQLNKIVHPAVARDSVQWFKKQSAEYALKEAALLVEIGAHKTLDKLIIVHADLEERIRRVMQRDGVNREEVLARENKQLKPEEKAKFADFIIDNTGNVSLVEQVLFVHRSLLEIKGYSKERT